MKPLNFSIKKKKFPVCKEIIYTNYSNQLIMKLMHN